MLPCRSHRKMASGDACSRTWRKCSDPASFCSSCFMRESATVLSLQLSDAVRGFQTFCQRCDQGNSHKAGTWVNSVRISCQIASGQNSDIEIAVKAPGEVGIAGMCFCPQIKSGIGHRHIKRALQAWRDGMELFRIQASILPYVRLVVPRGSAGGLYCRTHGTTLVGTVEQEFLQNCAIAGDEARAHPRYVGALGQTAEHHQIQEVASQD